MATTIFEDLLALGLEIVGFDASKYNDRPDTEKKPDLLTAIKVGFAFAGFRGGYGVVVDFLFDYYWKLCKGRVPRLCYWYLDYYSYASLGIDGVEWGKRQARAAWATHSTDPGELPLYLDIESTTLSGVAKISWANASKVTQIARAFLTEYDALSGGKAGIYCSIDFLRYFGEWFRDRPLWVAWYSKKSLDAEAVLKNIRSYKWKNLNDVIVQFSSTGDINGDGVGDGISLGFEENFLDLNYFLGNGIPTMEQWSKFAGECSGIPETGVITPEDGPETTTPEVVDTPEGHFVTVEVKTVACSSGLNIRNAPKSWAGSTVTGFIQKGKEVECLEKITVGSDIWYRVGQGQVVAGIYNGIKYLN